MKFKLSSFIYGMGTGIVVISLIYYIFYNSILNDHSSSNLQQHEYTRELTDAEIEGLARGLGMVYPSETE